MLYCVVSYISNHVLLFDFNGDSTTDIVGMWQINYSNILRHDMICI